MKMNDSLTLPPPRVVPELDPDFRPPILFNRRFRRLAAESGAAVPAALALEQADGGLFHFETLLLPDRHPEALVANPFYLERLVKFLLWSRGAFRLYVSAPPALVEALRRHFSETPTGRFDATLMGEQVYEKPFEVVGCDRRDLPPPHEPTRPLGRHLSGCRLGFDLGASDRKVAAVVDGEVVFSDEMPWNPVPQSDPQWHYDRIMETLRHGAAHLPRVDAIGGSAAGVYVNNRVKVASLFRGVPRPLFEGRVRNLFLEMQRAWKGVPFEVVNDGEVTALAGSMALNRNSLLGIAMGSSEAAGYVTARGTITTWLNELAFAPVDYNPKAPKDEWSGDRGCGALYFSQQAVGRLMERAGIPVSADTPLPVRLEEVQALMKQNDPRAARIYRTIGVYFGYTIAHYADFYHIENVLVLGRVMTGEGGNRILETARQVLKQEFPELFDRIAFHFPDERMKRHGQAVAAASLPNLPSDRP